MICKVCSSCGVEKSVSNFYRNLSYRDGFNGTCKECRKVYSRGYVKRNRKSLNEYMREYWKKHPDKYAKLKKQVVNRMRERYQTDSKYREKNKLKSRLRYAKIKED